MDLITDYPLGDDIAWTLLALVIVGAAAIVLGAVLPRRTLRDEDAESLDTGLGARLGSLLTGTVRTALLVGVPAALLLLLVPGSMDTRLLRSGMLLAGIVAGGITAWRAIDVIVPALSLDGPARRRLLGRTGALLVASSIAVAAVPAAITVWFLRQDSGTALLSFAAGAALFALAARLTGSFADVAAASSALLVGADENELERDGEANPGAAHQRISGVFRQGPGRAADLFALTAVLIGTGIAIGVAVLTVEGMIIPLLGALVAILAALLVAVIPQVGTEGEERSTLRLGALIPSIAGAAALVAAAALWLPGSYQSLRFAKVGLENFTDPAITGGSAVPRAQIEPQIQQVREQLGQMIASTDESASGRTLLDTVAIYGIHPHVVVAVALGVGALVALLAQALVAFAADRRNTPTLTVARTSRTGGALGALAGLGSAGTTAALVLLLLVAGLVVLFVQADGVPMLALLLCAYAGLGALVVVAGHAAHHTSAVLADLPGTDQPLRDATRTGDALSGTGVQVAAAFGALAVLAPLTNAVAATGRASAVWEDRALHDMTPASLVTLGGIGLGAATVLFVGTSLLESARRIGAGAVVDTRAALLEASTAAARTRGRKGAAPAPVQVPLEELEPGARRAALAPLVVAALMPVAVAFGLGAAGVPAYVGTVVLVGLMLSVWACTASASFGSAVDVIETGRYGGCGSWGHSAALGNAVLGVGLRASIGQLALPAALVTALSAVLSVGAYVALPTDGTNIFLRWGIAVLALCLIAVCVVVTAGVPEPDLEDAGEDLDEPLFGRSVEESDSLQASASWDEVAGEDEAPAPRSGRRRGREPRDHRTGE